MYRSAALPTRLVAARRAGVAAHRIPVGPRFALRSGGALEDNRRVTQRNRGAPGGGRKPHPNDTIPDVRDGLTREERTVLYVLHETQKERGDRNVPTAMLWGRVCEHFYIRPEDLSEMLARLGARKY
jgi:hypothetical protein